MPIPIVSHMVLNSNATLAARMCYAHDHYSVFLYGQALDKLANSIPAKEPAISYMNSI